ncbi:MAG: YggS family pyridoxal phosphate-dependent enzyme [Labrys sp. (in: a-proteobacteria)]|jgi:pyridoxal phosphate enzyme (YggS family)
MTDIRTRLAGVTTAIRRAEKDAGRPDGSVTLVAVSKLHGAEAIEEALAAGQRVFGENYVQEAKAKWPALRATWPGIDLHLIGPLQSNKAADAVALFDVIETLDRESLAAALAKAIARRRAEGLSVPRLLVQVNTGEEEQKGGVVPADVDAFLARCRSDHGLTIEGLMCIPPVDQPPGPHFALLAKIARRHGLSVLSMGMSGDYETAIEVGATHVRVGTAIFGERSAPVR